MENLHLDSDNELQLKQYPLAHLSVYSGIIKQVFEFLDAAFQEGLVLFGLMIVSIEDYHISYGIAYRLAMASRRDPIPQSLSSAASLAAPSAVRYVDGLSQIVHEILFWGPP